MAQLSSQVIVDNIMNNFLGPIEQHVANLPEFNQVDFVDFATRGSAAPYPEREEVVVGDVAVAAARADVEARRVAEEARVRAEWEAAVARREAAAAAAAARGPAGALGEAGLRGVDTDLFAGGQRGGSRAMVKPVVNRMLGVPAGSYMANVLSEVIDGNLVLSKKGTLIFNVPKSEELLSRAASVLYVASKGFPVTNANQIQIVGSDAFKEMPPSDRNTYVALFRLTQAQKDANVKWDERVEKIREALSVNNTAGVMGVIPVKQRLVRPSIVTMASFSNFSPQLQNAVRRARTPPTDNAMGTLNAIRELRVTGVPVFRGGANNHHAPLYPRMVMNGGAHPFATFNGGDVEPAEVLDAKIKSLLTQYQTVTGQPLAGPLAAQIQGYYPTVNQALKDVKEKLQELANANAALAQYPLGLGVDAPQTAAELKQYADRGVELNKAAERAARKMDKLGEIRDLLQDLVNRQTPVV